MHPKSKQKLVIFFIHSILLSIIFNLPISLCRHNQQNLSICAHPFHCGTIKNIGWPFRGPNRPPSCGYPGFDLDCHAGQLPLLNISSLTYRVLDINFPTHTLRVARGDLRNTTCPSTTAHLRDMTLDPDIFGFPPDSDDENVTFYYDCAANRTNTFLNQFTCDVGGVTTVNLFRTRNGGTGGIMCRNSVSVPVNRTAARALERAAGNLSINVLQDALASGFLIHWSADNAKCMSCLGSGGTCVYSLYSVSTVCLMGSHGRALVETVTSPPMASKEENATIIVTAPTGSVGTVIAPPTVGASPADSVEPQGMPPIQSPSPDGLNLYARFNFDHTRILVGAVLGILGGAILYLICKFLYNRRKRSRGGYNQERNTDIENFILQHGSLALKRYKYSEIKKMTKSLSDKLGQGGYGSVYKGKLPDGRLVAVKVLNDTNSNGEEFINEVASISRTSHVNIVNLLGFCYGTKTRALVYEYMPKKSLDKYMGNTSAADNLDLETLYKIAVGVAKGLEYLHTGCNTRIVHFDIKPQNILLDEDFCPKISDFGLARLCKKKQSLLSVFGTRGTPGYIAPEVFSRNFGGVSHKSDVYSYGMMVLEMAGAKTIVNQTETTNQSSENYFPDKIYEHVIADVNRRTMGEFTIEEEGKTARKMFLVGFWCIQTNPSDRPSISKVLEMLEGSVESIQIPPKPVLITPTLPVLEFSSSFSSHFETEPSGEGTTQTLL